MGLDSSTTETTELAGRHLCFTIGNEKLAIPLLDIKEVIGQQTITPIPQSPKHILGIINLRGQVISIIDLRLKLGIGNGKMGAETTTIIMNYDQLSIGVVVDSVDSVMHLEKKDVSSPPFADMQMKSDYIQGVARVNESLILLLNLQKILNIEDTKIIMKQKAA